jgi:hypothetical protein
MRAIIALLGFAVVLLTAIAYMRPPEYDEAYSIFLTTRHAHPVWPAAAFTPAQVRAAYAPGSSFGGIMRSLRSNDVHPPLYFWSLLLWRRVFGAAWFTARLLSVLYATLSLAVLARIAVLTRTPVVPAILVCVLTYGFAYTSVIARNFALAQLLTLLGVMLTIDGAGETPSAYDIRHLTAFAGGFMLGAATFTNYLTLFPALTALAFTPRDAAAAGTSLANARSKRKFFASPGGAPFFQKRSAFLPFAIFLPFDAYIFAAQHHSRPTQFVAFSLPHAVVMLAKDSAAAWFGGLPVYAGRLAAIVTVLLVVLAGACIFSIRRTPYTPLFGALAVSTPLGLLVLGLVFNSTPIEIRYLAFSLPYLSLLLAGLRPRLLGLLLAVQALAVIGLAFAPATSQPQERAARQAAALDGPGGIVLVPYGNDGVGVPGPFIAAAPAGMPILLLHPGETPDLGRAKSVILATIAIDDSSRAAVAQTLAFFETSGCWRESLQTPLARRYVDACQ